MSTTAPLDTPVMYISGFHFNTYDIFLNYTVGEGLCLRPQFLFSPIRDLTFYLERKEKVSAFRLQRKVMKCDASRPKRLPKL